MTDPRAQESARSALAHDFSRAEMEALDRASAAVTADYVTLLAASMKAEGMDREPWAADLLAEAIEAGYNAKRSLRRRAGTMGKDGAEYRIVEEGSE